MKLTSQQAKEVQATLLDAGVFKIRAYDSTLTLEPKRKERQKSLAALIKYIKQASQEEPLNSEKKKNQA